MGDAKSIEGCYCKIDALVWREGSHHQIETLITLGRLKRGNVNGRMDYSRRATVIRANPARYVTGIRSEVVHASGPGDILTL
jgi:hypothetical protein